MTTLNFTGLQTEFFFLKFNLLITKIFCKNQIGHVINGYFFDCKIHSVFHKGQNCGWSDCQKSFFLFFFDRK